MITATTLFYSRIINLLLLNVIMKRGLLLLLCVMQSFIFVLHAQNTQRNIAYTDDNVRFTVISDGAIRLEYAPDGKFVDDRSHIVVNRNYPQVDYKLKTRGGWVEITTSKMKMRYKKTVDSLQIRTWLSLPLKKYYLLLGNPVCNRRAT